MRWLTLHLRAMGLTDAELMGTTEAALDWNMRSH